MTEARTPPPPTPSAPGSEERRDFVKYTFLHIRPEWRLRPAEERTRAKAKFIEALERPPDGVLTRSYSLVGLKAGTEMMVWSIASDLRAIQELHGRLFGTPLGGYLETSHSYLGLARRSEYLGEHAHGGEGASGERRPFDLPYLFVYPFVKKREWYGLPFEERRRVMGEHFRIGHKFPGVQIHTGYSFGLDDMEFILSFEAETPAEFLDLVSDLRPTEASRYTALETPIFTCLLSTPGRMLDLAEGLS
jgi:chlorite dismutase